MSGVRGRHAGASVPAWTVPATFIVTTVAAWAIGASLDFGVKNVSDKGPLVAEQNVSESGDVVVPAKNAKSYFDASQESFPVSGPLNLRFRAVTTDLSITLLVYGTRDHPVIIQGIDAKDVRCKKPTEKVEYLYTPDQGAGLPDLPVEIALNDGKVVAGSPASGDMVGNWRFPRQVSTSNADQFLIEPVVVEPGDICSFELRIRFTDGGAKKSRLVTNGGASFVLAGVDPTWDKRPYF